MKKPNQIRDYLIKSLPELAFSEDRLLIFVNNGSIRSTVVSGYSFEMSYLLDIIITDYAGDVDKFALTFLTWIQMHQPELMTNHEKGKKAIQFEAELIDNSKYDLKFSIELTERVIVKTNQYGKLEISYPGEPSIEDNIHFLIPVTGKNP